MIGEVLWFDRKLGYGYIRSKDITSIFVHYSSIICEGYKELFKGQIVEFTLLNTRKGCAAIDVIVSEIQNYVI